MSHANRAALCKDFHRDKDLRFVVFGTTQLCLDLCCLLELPSQVAISSLQCFQTFLCECRWDTVELPILASSCVLITWKYWEDVLPIRNSRKLFEISKKLFRLLVSQDVSDDEEPLGKEVTVFNNKKRKQQHEEKSSYYYAELQANKSQLSVTEWMLLDKGKELYRLRDRIKLYEACVLRCMNFEVGPFEHPFDQIKFLCYHFWNEQKAFNEKNALNSKMTTTFSQFLYLTHGIVFDYYRTPFCLLSSTQAIALTAVWKAAVALEFSYPFKELFNAATATEAEESSRKSNYLWRKKFFSISDTVIVLILQRLRYLYEWLEEFNAQYKTPRKEHYKKLALAQENEVTSSV